MRIALIADTHGALDARIAEAVKGVDVLVHAGDVGDGVVAAMASLSERLVIVHGNNDPEGSGWPERETLDLPGGELVVVHGHQWPARTRHRKLREQFPQARAVVCGHSHRRVVDRETDPWVLNPGAAGRTRAYGGPGWIELTVGTRGWQVRASDLEPLKPKRR